MNTFAVNSALCTRTTASSTSSSAAGTAATGTCLRPTGTFCTCSPDVRPHAFPMSPTPSSPHPLPSPTPPSAIMTGSYNNFFRMFDRNTRRDITLEASRESSKPRATLKPRKVSTGGKRKKDEISVDSLDFNKKILHTAWHPKDNVIAVAATNNLYIFQDKIN